MRDRELIKKSKDLDKRIIAIPEDKVFTKRVVTIGFLILFTPVAYLVWSVRGIAANTNEAVTREVPALKETISDYESITTQQTDAILLLIGVLREHGIEPPEIVIRPED